MMRAAEALERLRSLPLVPFENAFPTTPIAILAPHPDDESLGCGGLIAEACQRGTPPHILILTDGTGSHPRSRQYPADRLRGLREAETRAALAELGLPHTRLTFLRYRDTAAPASGPALAEAASHLAAILRAKSCDTLVTPWRHDPHGDHKAAAALATATSRHLKLRLLAYPIWGLTLAPDTLLPDQILSGFQLDITPHIRRKRAAILAHASQYAGVITDDPDGFQMQPDFIDLFLQNTEIFIE